MAVLKSGQAEMTAFLCIQSAKVHRWEYAGRPPEEAVGHLSTNLINSFSFRRDLNPDHSFTHKSVFQVLT